MGDVRKAVAATVVAALACLVAGCGGSSGSGSTDGRLSVIAAENFWGNLTQQIGGSHVDVTSLITNPDADPHLFEPGTSNGYAVAKAGVVVVNGANYDPFMTKLLNASSSSHRVVVTVASVLQVSGSDPNPHLWYDTPELPTVVHAIAGALTHADPAHAAAYRAGATRTIAALQPLEKAVQQLKATDAGEPVAYTERVPGYLLTAAGLKVVTPGGFAHDVEDGIDPSFADIAAMDDLLNHHQIKALLYNEQTTGPVTSQVESLARKDGIPVVPVTETMPAHDTFQAWQLGQVSALTKALAS
jgi:zinc/manganese transport system substrate-binding protein